MGTMFCFMAFSAILDLYVCSISAIQSEVLLADILKNGKYLKYLNNIQSLIIYLYLLKIVIALLAAIEIAHIVLAIVRSSDPEYSVYSVDYVTPIILLFSYCFVVFFIFYELKYGLRSSMLLFAYWGFLLLFSTFKFRSKIIQHTEEVTNFFIRSNVCKC